MAGYIIRVKEVLNVFPPLKKGENVRARFEARARSVGGEPLRARVKTDRVQLHT